MKREDIVITNPDTNEQAVNYLNKINLFEEVMIDTETDGLYGFVRLIQLYQRSVMGSSVLILDMAKLDKDIIYPLIKPLYGVYHNAPYDFGCLNFSHERFEDTLWMARLTMPRLESFTLDSVYKALFHEDLYSGIDKKEMQTKGFHESARISKKQLRYAAYDVIALDAVYSQLKHGRVMDYKHRDFAAYEKLTPLQKQIAKPILTYHHIFDNKAYNLDKETLRYLVEIQQNGLVVHQPSVMKEYSLAMNKLKDLPKYNINLGSSKQVKDYLTNELAYKVTSTNKTELTKVMQSTNVEAAKLADTVLKYKRLKLRINNLTKYLHKRKLYTRFNPLGTKTGRFSAKGGDGLENSINAQNITRDLQYIFQQDTENTTVIKLDYSTAELLSACSIMQEPQMRKYILNNIDLHKVSARMVTGDAIELIDKPKRQKGKAVSFGFVFGMGWATFIDYAKTSFGVEFSESEARRIHFAYGKEYPMIRRFARMKWNTYKDNPSFTPLNRVIYSKLGTEAINASVQGSIAEAIKLAFCKSVKYTNKESLKYAYNIVHDSQELRVPKGQEERFAIIHCNDMLRAWKEICECDIMHYKDLPMKVEYEYIDSVTGKKVVVETSEINNKY